MDDQKCQTPPPEAEVHDLESRSEPLPFILRRGEHPISRRDIDPDVFKVIYRLHEQGFTAYLVGGAVRDLLLGKTPKDFDVATDARPGQIKKRFRNAFLIGRRFRLAHVHFSGGKIIEVATFRRDPGPGSGECALPEATPGEEATAEGSTSGASPVEGPWVEGPEPGFTPDIPPEDEPEPEPGSGPATSRPEERGPEEYAGPGSRRRRPLPEHLNVYGTPSEDAFRRDTTINGLFFDVITSSVIDYVGGLEDLALRKVRIIGDPAVRFTEDPVRIWRVIRQAARLRFEIEEETERAIPRLRELVGGCSSARLYEELNKELTNETMPVVEALNRHGLLPFILGGIGAAYGAEIEAFDRLLSILQAKDRAAAAGAEFSLEELYTLLFWPWVESRLAPANGDLPAALKEVYGSVRTQVQIPKAIMAGVVQTQAIMAVLDRALKSGNMRWSLRGRPHFAQAVRLFFLATKLRLPEPHESFVSLYAEAFPERPTRSKRHRHRRPRKRNGSGQPPAGSQPS